MKLALKQKDLLIKWIEESKHKITGADDLTLEQYQRLTDIKDFDGFEVKVNGFLHAYNYAKEYKYI